MSERCFGCDEPLEGYRSCWRCEGQRNRRMLDSLAALCARSRTNPPQLGPEERALEKQLAELGHNFPREFVAAVSRPKPSRSGHDV